MKWMHYDSNMSSTIQVKNASEELKSRLRSSAERNFRSLNQEALARLEFSFDIEDGLVTKLHQSWMDEALAGTFKPGSIKRLKQIAQTARSGK